MKVTPQSSGSPSPLPLSNLDRPVELAYDGVEHRVYWTDDTRRTISRSFLNGSSQEVIINTKLKYLNGLAVDIVGRNLYWADESSSKLEVSKLDGSYRTAIVTSDLSGLGDIILDVNKRFVLLSFLFNLCCPGVVQKPREWSITKNLYFDIGNF